MSKRKLDDIVSDTDIVRNVRQVHDNTKKHSLDSDEEDDNDDADNVLDDNEFEGEEEGVSSQDGEVRMTAFNMQEELELGHFDSQGHFLWNNEKEVRDNWLDNIDWHKIKTNAKGSEANVKGLADESDSDEETFDEIKTYELVITYMKPKENISKAIRRLGSSTEKLSSIERIRRKKAGILNTNKEVTELTELADRILSNMGNMDIYQETYEQISQKIENYNRKHKSKANIVEGELDMYADNFDDQEREKLGNSSSLERKEELGQQSSEMDRPKLLWEFKWQQDTDDIQGPFTTEQMLKWSNEGYFKTGVLVRKCGENKFYTSNRIDFDLYL